MKAIALALLLVFTLGACSKDEKKNPSPNAKGGGTVKPANKGNKPQGAPQAATDGKKKSDEKVKQEPPASTNYATLIQGGFQSDCITLDSGEHVQRFLILFDGQYYYEEDVFADANCTTFQSHRNDGFADYELGGADTRSGAAAGTQLINWITGGETFYDIFAMIDNNTVVFGDTSAGNTSEEDRPMQFENIIYYRMF